jgi:hypothetical protein
MKALSSFRIYQGKQTEQEGEICCKGQLKIMATENHEMINKIHYKKLDLLAFIVIKYR